MGEGVNLPPPPMNNSVNACFVKFYWLTYEYRSKISCISLNFGETNYSLIYAVHTLWKWVGGQLLPSTQVLEFAVNDTNGHIFADSPSIRCRNSTWKVRGNSIDFERQIHVELWHRFHAEISTWVRLSKLKKYQWVLHVDFYMPFRRRIDVTSELHCIIS